MEDLQSRLAEIQLLTEEEEKSHALEYREKSEESAKLAQTLKTLNENKTWRSEVNRFLLHVQALEQNWNIYIAEEKAAQTDLKRLDQALKALNYAGDYRDLCSLKKLQKDDLEIRSNEMAKKSRLEASLIEKNQALQSHQKNLDDLLEEQKCLSEILKQVREIDKEAQQERRKLQALSEQMSKEENNAAILKKSVEDHQTRQKSYEAQLISIQDYFDRSACDATLVEKFSSIKENIDRFKSKKNIIEEKQKEYTSCLGRLAEAKKQADEDRKSVEAAKAASDNSKNALQVLVDDCALISEGKDALRWDEERKALDQQEKLFAELSKSVELHKDSENTRKKNQDALSSFAEKLSEGRKSEKQILSEIETVDRSIEELTGRQALQNRIQSLEEERTQLCDNTPCPLCGSVEHPYAHGKTPDLRKTDAQLNEARQQRKELEKAHREAAKEIAEIEAEMRVRLQSQKEESKRLSGLKEKSGALIEQLGLKNEAVPSYPEVNQKHEESQSRLNAFETKYTAYLKKGRDKEKAQKAYDKEYQKYFHLQQQLETLAATQNTHENHVHYLKQECLRLDQEHSALEISLLESVRAYGIFTFANAGLEAIKEDLARRLDTWKQQLEARNHVEGEIQKVLPQNHNPKRSFDACEGCASKPKE